MGHTDYTGLLYASPSLRDGFAHVLDVGGTFDDYNYGDSDSDSDEVAIAADWYAVGADLDHAIGRYAASVGHGGSRARSSKSE